MSSPPVPRRRDRDEPGPREAAEDGGRASGAAGHLGLVLLYAGAFALGALETLFAACAHAALPSLVGSDDLGRANGYVFAAQTAGEQVIGSATGGLLFAAVVALPFALDSASF